MNNRYYRNDASLISRLADRAHDKSFEIYTNRTKSERADAVIFYDIFNQQFAELIIEECAQICNNIDSEYKGEDVLATWCAKAIKEHFGL